MTLMAPLVQQRKSFIINFSKTKTKYCLSLHHNHDKVICLLMENKYMFKADNKNVFFCNSVLSRKHI